MRNVRGENKMQIKLLMINCFIASSFAWLAPERCAQSEKYKTNVTLVEAKIKHVKTVPSIEDIAAKQHEALIETYKNHRFVGVPIRAATDEEESVYPTEFNLHVPYHCTFYTHDPQLLSSVACIDAGCKLSHTVSTKDSYTASESYNWSVKISSKLTFFKVFEVGGEASTGGTYTCTYTKERTTTDTVECSDLSGKSGHLQLYNVKSDMVCDFGEVKFKLDLNKTSSSITYGLIIHFTDADVQELRASAQVFIKCTVRDWFVMDTDKISDALFQKFLSKYPNFNPYTDLISLGSRNYDDIIVLPYKQISAVQQYRRIIPFTNEAGNSVYQYVCNKVPF